MQVAQLVKHKIKLKMKTLKYCKQIKAIMLITIVASLFWFYWAVIRTINTLNDVPFRDDYEILQWGIAVGYCAFALSLMVVQMVFMVKQIKSITNGVLFDRSSAKILVLWGLLWVGYDLCSANVGQMLLNEVFNEIVIHGTTVGIPVIAFTFAVLYRMAADVAEENNLTI